MRFHGFFDLLRQFEHELRFPPRESEFFRSLLGYFVDEGAGRSIQRLNEHLKSNMCCSVGREIIGELLHEK